MKSIRKPVLRLGRNSLPQRLGRYRNNYNGTMAQRLTATDTPDRRLKQKGNTTGDILYKIAGLKENKESLRELF